MRLRGLEVPAWIQSCLGVCHDKSPCKELAGFDNTRGNELLSTTIQRHNNPIEKRLIRIELVGNDNNIYGH